MMSDIIKLHGYWNIIIPFSLYWTQQTEKR